MTTTSLTMPHTDAYKLQIADDRLTGAGFDLAYVLDQLYDAERQPLAKSFTLLFRAGTRMDMEKFIEWLEDKWVSEIRLEMPGVVPFDVIGQDCSCESALQKTVEGVLVWELHFRCLHIENEPVDLSTPVQAPASATVTCLTAYRASRAKP